MSLILIGCSTSKLLCQTKLSVVCILSPRCGSGNISRFFIRKKKTTKKFKNTIISGKQYNVIRIR